MPYSDPPEISSLKECQVYFFADVIVVAFHFQYGILKAGHASKTSAK